MKHFRSSYKALEPLDRDMRWNLTLWCLEDAKRPVASVHPKAVPAIRYVTEQPFWPPRRKCGPRVTRRVKKPRRGDAAPPPADNLEEDFGGVTEDVWSLVRSDLVVNRIENIGNHQEHITRLQKLVHAAITRFKGIAQRIYV